MPECNEVHLKKIRGEIVVVPHFYIAGSCIISPCNQGNYESFLRATYPCYQSENYEDSKKYHGELIETLSDKEISERTQELLKLWNNKI